MTKIGLIDADIVAFRCAATCNNEVFKIAVYRMEDMLNDIFCSVKANEYKMYLTGKDNFRKKIDPEYKANRKDSVKPLHLDDCRDYLATKWKAYVTDGIEADDALGIEQCEHLNNPEINTVICSIDKDLLQIPGEHYNFLHKEHTVVDELNGVRHFYKQLLIGDTSDNVFGVKGIGKVKAGNLLDSITNEEEMYYIVKDMYNHDERLHRNCDVLWILRKQDEIWRDRSFHLITELNQVSPPL